MRKTEDNVLVDVDLFASKSQVGSLPPRVLPSEIREFRKGRKLSFTFMRKEEIDDPKSILTLFCIHGSMANQNQFGDLLTALQKDLAQQDWKYNVVCFDALGCGESDKPKDSLQTEQIVIFVLADFVGFFHSGWLHRRGRR